MLATKIKAFLNFRGVGPSIATPGDNVQVIDATGRYVMPGGIDPHTHLQMPFMGATAADDFVSGTQAAVAGGTTMVGHEDKIILQATIEAVRKVEMKQQWNTL